VIGALPRVPHNARGNIPSLSPKPGRLTTILSGALGPLRNIAAFAAFGTVATIALACHAPSAMASPLLDALNATRAAGCGGKPGVTAPLQEDAPLAEAARLLAQGVPIKEALSRNDYRAQHSATIRVRGGTAPEAVSDAVAKTSCARLLDSSYRDIGVYRQGSETWMLIAAPFLPPAPESASAVAARVLELVNEARGGSRRCGNAQFRPVGPVQLNGLLNRAAQAHASDMAGKSYFAHQGHDGSTPADRVTRTGYLWRAVGENLASGMTTPEALVQGWLRSATHCATLMAPQYTEMGIAFAVNRASQAGIYWGQVLATPRD